ncbi:CehA/McbA family metallohydrolase [Paenibacillus alba]|uniref:CehA/McbA family metallohydrolase n=1 Tax=Paenibacillus alba TaxID=1197127 RepID=A0ABU6G1F9_9BACL|nr:CehA/McbA family metallohydrolase [Paenibacillus alba]MEC0227489.1 CehA/McbA family metallohydrolase [Paenibacillus alba]
MTHIHNPYDKHGIWLRGSFHNHTTGSDGHHSLSTVYRMYHDYDFLGISDHDRITVHEGEHTIGTLFEAIEVSSSQTHMLLVHPPSTLMEGYSNEFSIANYQRLSDACVENGGLSILAHPNRFFSHYWRHEDMLSMQRYNGIEVVNGDGNPEYDIAFDKWDYLLSAGRKVWGFGNDDFHVYGQEKRAWNMVLAKEKTNEAILAAIREGSFYVSTGYGFAEIRVEEGQIIYDLRSSPLYDKMYKYVTLIGKEGRILHEETGRMKQVKYAYHGDEGYIRIAVYVEGGFGAFSQPLFVE